MVRSSASFRLSWPPIMFSHSGVLASSKSASHTLAPEFSALMVIRRSVGPVISTRRSTSPGAPPPRAAPRGRGRGPPPVRVGADVRRLGQEVERRAVGQLYLPAPARREQLLPAGPELGVERGNKVDGLWCQDLVVTIPVRPGDLHAFGS